MDQTDPYAPALTPVPSPEEGEQDLDQLLRLVAVGDQHAFDLLYRQLAGPAYGVIRRVVRDPEQTEEVTQEVLLEVWRTATRFESAKGSAATWVLTIAHRRAVDRVRSEAAAAGREQKTSWAAPGTQDDVADLVVAGLDRERVQGCLGSLTDMQRESIALAYYSGYTYRQVAALAGVTLSAIKSRIRDGLLRMRDCLGVA